MRWERNEIARRRDYYRRHRDDAAAARHVRTVYNRLLGAWFNVVGAHQSPIGGAYATRADALAALARHA